MNMTPARLRAAFLPLVDADRVRVALMAADLIAAVPGPVAVHCLGAWYKSYRRADAWPRAHASVCYRVTGATVRGRPHEHILHGWARLNRGQRSAQSMDVRPAPAAPVSTNAPSTPWTQDRVAAQPRAEIHTATESSASPVAPLPPRCVTLDTMTLHLWHFPEDPSLPGLRTLWTLPHGRADTPPDVVSYRPGARAVLRYGRDGDTPEIYAKAFASADQARSVFERSQRIHAAGSATFSSAPPLTLDAGNAAVWHLGVAGVPLPQTLASGFDADLVTRMAQALSTLHALPHGALPHLTLADQHNDADKKLARLQRLSPRLQLEFAAMRQSLLQDHSAAGDAPEVALHGDFHLRQWLRQGDRITLCDFDEICLGAPETDLASLLMDLSMYGLSAADVSAWTAVFTRAYAACAPWGLRHRALEWHLRAQTINKMHRAHVQLQPGLTGRCRHLLSHLATVTKALPRS